MVNMDLINTINVNINITQKDAQVLIELVKAADPTGLFTGDLAQRIFSQAQKQVKSVEKEKPAPVVFKEKKEG